LQSFFSARRQELALTAQPLRDDALRTALSAFSALGDYPFVARFFRADAATHGWRMHYLDEGPADSGAAVLCLHDVPGWSYRYRQLIPALSARGIRVIAPDLIGFGMSDKPKKEAVHTLGLHLDSLQRLVEHLRLTNPLLIGVGAGVHLAQILARQLSTPIHKVVQLLPEASTAVDKLPYPDRGYQAGLRAVPLLIAQLEQSIAFLQSAGQCHKVEVLDGTPDVVAERLAALFLNR
jgi:tRNA(adenine34) deaminase